MLSQRRRLHNDPYTKRARQEGLPARSVYKLSEIATRWRLFKPHLHVLDLGAAPGSWSLYASQSVGPQGRIVGVDLKPLTLTNKQIAEHPQLQTLVADVFNDDFLQTLPLPHVFDLVLSDMAPATMGNHQIDAARSFNLASRALELAEKCLKAGGHTVIKILEGQDLKLLEQRLQQLFGKLERLRPKATRKCSTEIFLIGLDKRV